MNQNPNTDGARVYPGIPGRCLASPDFVFAARFPKAKFECTPCSCLARAGLNGEVVPLERRKGDREGNGWTWLAVKLCADADLDLRWARCEFADASMV
jgi:hypothetical protein